MDNPRDENEKKVLKSKLNKRSKMYIGAQDSYVHQRHKLYQSFIYKGRLTRAERMKRKDGLKVQDITSMEEMINQTADMRLDEYVLFGIKVEKEKEKPPMIPRQKK